jgi:hypothetical protein
MHLGLVGVGLLVWLGRRGYKHLDGLSRKKARQAKMQANGDAGEAAVSDCLQSVLQAISEGPFCLRNSLILRHSPRVVFAPISLSCRLAIEYADSHAATSW